ncbi:MAG: DegT/DnrJ/EryC1/StrS family aminotransferase [Candidatus Bathyarchaeota archaeon]
MSEKPAVLGGKPEFREILPIVRPPIKAVIEQTLLDYGQIFESGMLTNFRYVRELEERTASYTGAKYCVATANCTSALMLTLKAFDIHDGEVLVPSFTFPATAHAVRWNNLRVKLVDSDPYTFNVDAQSLQEKVTDDSKVIMPVHVFGNPCDIKAILEIADDHDLKVVFDAAHAFGAKYEDVNIGQFGDAEVFSGSPTKVFTTVEGGLVTTNLAEIADKVTIGRNYGHKGGYDCEIPGLSARMSELHAALGLNLLPRVNLGIDRRNHLAKKYKEGLSRLPGIKFQEITKNCRSSYKDFSLLVNKEEFGLTRDELVVCLERENIMTRTYFYPTLHMQTCYPELRTNDTAFPKASYIARNIICLPMFSDMIEEQVEGVIRAFVNIHEYAEEIKFVLLGEKS